MKVPSRSLKKTPDELRSCSTACFLVPAPRLLYDALCPHLDVSVTATIDRAYAVEDS